MRDCAVRAGLLNRGAPRAGGARDFALRRVDCASCANPASVSSCRASSFVRSGHSAHAVSVATSVGASMSREVAGRPGSRSCAWGLSRASVLASVELAARVALTHLILRVRSSGRGVSAGRAAAGDGSASSSRSDPERRQPPAKRADGRVLHAATAPPTAPRRPQRTRAEAPGLQAFLGPAVPDSRHYAGHPGRRRLGVSLHVTLRRHPRRHASSRSTASP